MCFDGRVPLQESLSSGVSTRASPGSGMCRREVTVEVHDGTRRDWSPRPVDRRRFKERSRSWTKVRSYGDPFLLDTPGPSLQNLRVVRTREK